jgi:hypothetical protein
VLASSLPDVYKGFNGSRVIIPVTRSGDDANA